MHLQRKAVARLDVDRPSSPDPATVLRVLREVDSCATPDAIRDVLLKNLIPFGFKGFTLTTDRRMKSLFVHAQIMMTWPAEANSYFMANNLLNSDPVIQRWHFATEPFVWDLSIYGSNCREHAPLLALRHHLGVTGGICVPIHKNFGGRTTLFISGDGFPTDDDMVLSLRIMVQHVMARLASLKSTDVILSKAKVFLAQDVNLSVRERTVLGWIALGKSSRETAIIMALSEHTVNEHIANAVAKLNASNRTEAVLRALLLDEINLQ
jgi:LuxR family quorum sensing-dependent transcriptional regulator